jgi:hypothetical protein
MLGGRRGLAVPRRHGEDGSCGRWVRPGSARRWLIVWMEIFWLLLLVGALVMLIPVARQVFRRSDDDQRRDDS